MSTTQGLTIIHRILNAFNKIGLSNGTKIAEPEYNGEDKSNSARDTWLNEWTVLAEYTVAKTLESRAEKRAKEARARLETAFGPTIAGLKVGDSVSIVRGNVTTYLNLRNGARRINQATVISVLTQDYNWKLDDIDKLIEKIAKADKPALYITPTTTAE